MLFLKRILVLLGFVLIGILFWFYLKGNELIISWDTISELFQKEIYSTGFSFEGLNVPLDNLVYYLKSHFFPSIYKVNKLAYYLSLGTLLFGVSTVLGVLSYKRYLFGLALLALTFLSFRLENIFLSTSSFPFLIGFLAFGILYYAISNWFTQISLIQRISIFLGLFLIMIFIVKKWGKINEPVLELATFSSIISFISFIASCVWIGTQLSKILVGLINNNAKKGVSQLYPYLILNLILILNLFLVYLESSKLIEPNFFLISPLFYWILAVFSFWNEGLKKDDQVFFLELGLSFGALAFFILTYGTANDSHLDLSNDIIAVSFLSFSIGYFAYILLNFHGPIRQGLSIEKIMGKPLYVNWSLIQFASFFLAILLIANKRLFSYYQLVSGNAINKADFYLEEGDLSAAEAFYKESVVYDPLNHKANYALGSLALTAENKLQANYYFEQSLQRSPSAYSYAALAQSLFSENDFFQAQFKLQEGLQIFPNSIELLTNLGYLKDISNSRDSSFYYWDKAYSNCQKCEVPQTNLQAFWIENAKSNKIDSIKTALDKGINKSGLDVLSQKPAFHTIEKDSILSLENFAPLFNYYDKFPDKADLNYLISLEKNENNFNFFQELRYLISKGNYAKDKKTKAILSIKQQISDDSAFSKFLSNQLANIYLSEGLFSQGIKSLKRSKDSSALSKSFEEQLLAKEKAYIRMQADIALNDTLAVLKYPYNPIILRRILDDPKNKSQIYNKLLEATEINPNSGEIWKLYSLSSLENGLFSYADSGLEKVRDLVSVAEYTSFKKEFEAKKKTQQGLMEEFK